MSNIFDLMSINGPDGASQPAAQPSLMNNNLLWQYLSAAGAAMSDGKPIAGALNQITQQNIGAQSKVKMQNEYLKQLSGMIKGTEAAGGKATGPTLKMDGKGMNISLPHARINDDSDTAGLLAQLMGGETTQAQPTMPQAQSYQQLSQILSEKNNQQQATQPDDGVVQGIPQMPQLQAANPNMPTNIDPTMQNKLLSAMLNPQISPLSISNADLAGLSSSDVSQALHDTLGVERTRQGTLMNASDLAARSDDAIIRGQENQIRMVEQYRKMKEIPEKVPVEVNGQTLWVKPENALTHYTTANKLPTSYETFKLAQGDPEFMKYLKEEARSKGVTVNVGDRAEQTEIGKASGKMQTGDFMQSVRDDLMKEGNRELWHNPPDYKALRAKGLDDEQAMSKSRELMILKETDKRVRAQYSKSKVERKSDGWYVDGELKVRYTP